MEELLKQVNEYLESKIPDTPKSTRNEIAAFLVHRFIIHEVDAIEKVNREWKKTLFGQKVIARYLYASANAGHMILKSRLLALVPTTST